MPHGSHNIVAIDLIKDNLENQLSKRINFKAKLTKNIEFLQNDIFDNKTFQEDTVKIIKEQNLMTNMKSILEDILNKVRPIYNK